MKSNDNFTIFLSCSIALHLLLLYFFLFGMPSLFEKLPEEQTITFEMLPVIDKSNIITKTKQEEAPVENEDAKKSERTKPKEEEQPDLPIEEKVKEQEKTVEEKPKIEETKPIEEPKQAEVKEALPEAKEEVKEEKPKEEEKKKIEETKPKEKPKEVKKEKPKTDELDSLLKNLEQSSEGDNVKSNKQKRSKKVDNKKESKGVYTEGLPLSSSEASLIKRQIERHWSNIPAGARGNNKAKVIISITLDKGGNVEQVKVKEKNCPDISGSVCEALAESAVRAVWQASPIENLDPGRFNHWKEINFNFDPSRL